MTDNISKKIIGASLKFWRKQSGLSQSDISVDLDIPCTTYQSYELGKSEPSILVLKTLASFYNLSIEELIDSNSLLWKQKM